MRRYLLDTTPLAAYLFGRPPVVSLVESWLTSQEASRSILVYGEVIEYLLARPDLKARQTQLRRLLRAIPPLFLSYSVFDHYARLRRCLRPPHETGPIGDVDTLIAATALERNLTVVTTDGDYGRVPSLDVLMLDRRTLTPIGGEAR